MKKKILIINGPNLNLLGIREPDIYGRDSLKAVNKNIKNHGHQRNVKIIFYQSNHEGKIIDKIHTLIRGGYTGLIINPGALTHYSYAIRDAIKAINCKVIEVHISDINNRDPFRSESVIKDVCFKQIAGHGINGYMEALDILIEQPE
jgi:3-dehydroquinate dehydratase-2